MSRNVRLFSHATIPAQAPAPAAAGEQVQELATGALLESINRTGAGVRWRLVSPGPILGNVRAAVSQNLTGSVTASGDGMTLTANANGSFNTPGYGGVTDYVVGQRVLLWGNGSPLSAINGVFTIADLGSAGTPFILSRSLDARDVDMCPRGRTFGVLSGDGQGRVFAHVTPGVTEPTFGVTPLGFQPVDNAANFVTAEDLSAFGIVGTGWSGFASPEFTLEATIPAGAAGARDVQVLGGGGSNPTLPFGFEVLELTGTVSTAAGAGATAQARSATGGGGSPLSGPAPIDATGRTRDEAGGGLTAAATVAANGSLVLRMTDGTAAGRFFFRCVRTP